MKKILLCALIALTTLISCTKEDDLTKDKSFEYTISESKFYSYNSNAWVEDAANSYYVTPQSIIRFIDANKVIEMEGLGTHAKTSNPVTIENNIFIYTFKDGNNNVYKHTHEVKNNKIEYFVYFNNSPKSKYVFTITP